MALILLGSTNGNGYGNGFGDESGDGYGYGYGNGYANGDGYGCAYGNRNRNGNGNGNGYGHVKSFFTKEELITKADPLRQKLGPEAVEGILKGEAVVFLLALYAPTHRRASNDG